MTKVISVRTKCSKVKTKFCRVMTKVIHVRTKCSKVRTKIWSVLKLVRGQNVVR